MQNIKNIEAKFLYDGKLYNLSCPFNQLDRNYDDENYAYFLKQIPNTTDGFFEVNILKDGDGGDLLAKGYVSIYSNIEDGIHDELIDAQIIITYF